MALLTSEVERIRAELGYNVLSVGAEPYISYSAVFDQVIVAYLQAGATTTSSTAVTASTTPAPATLTIASATGFAAGDTAVLDVDSRQESAIIQAKSGSTITLLLSLAHTGTYPVTVQGGETIVREILREIAKTKRVIGGSALTSAGLKRADEVEWYPGGFAGSAAMTDAAKTLKFWRRELASVLGVQNLWNLRAAEGRSVALY